MYAHTHTHMDIDMRFQTSQRDVAFFTWKCALQSSVASLCIASLFLLRQRRRQYWTSIVADVRILIVYSTDTHDLPQLLASMKSVLRSVPQQENLILHAILLERAFISSAQRAHMTMCAPYRDN